MPIGLKKSYPHRSSRKEDADSAGHWRIIIIMYRGGSAHCIRRACDAESGASDFFAREAELLARQIGLSNSRWCGAGIPEDGMTTAKLEQMKHGHLGLFFFFFCTTFLADGGVSAGGRGVCGEILARTGPVPPRRSRPACRRGAGIGTVEPCFIGPPLHCPTFPGPGRRLISRRTRQRRTTLCALARPRPIRRTRHFRADSRPPGLAPCCAEPSWASREPPGRCPPWRPRLRSRTRSGKR